MAPLSWSTRPLVSDTTAPCAPFQKWDPELWFGVLMGEDYRVDVRSAEKLAEWIYAARAELSRSSIKGGELPVRNLLHDWSVRVERDPVGLPHGQAQTAHHKTDMGSTTRN